MVIFSNEIAKSKKISFLMEGKQDITLPVRENTSLNYRFLNLMLPFRLYNIIGSIPKNPPE
jgi:hypothetical protein